MVQDRFLSAGLLVLLSLFISTQLFAQSGVIKERKKLMKANSAANKALKKAFAMEDYATVEAKAKIIAGNAAMILDLFPKGTTGEDSRAKPEIWEKWDEFGKKVAALNSAATALANETMTKDMMKVGPKMKALGATCGGCHKPFRGPRKKKK